MSDLSPSEWIEKTVRISGGQLYFGDVKLPGLIEDNGIRITPGANEINRISVTFLVGKVEIEDPILDQPGHQATLFARSSIL